MTQSFKIPLLILALVAMGLINLMFVGSATSVNDIQPDLRVNASKIYRSFCEDEVQARQQYIDKLIEVSGVLRSVTKGEGDQYILSLDFERSMGQLLCELDGKENPDLENLKIGEAITVKGFCRKYAFEVSMDHSILIKQP